MAPLTLYYFPVPGRAEAARLMLSINKIDFVDKAIPFEDWPEWKSKAPFGQVPYMEVEGKTIAQMAAIDHYIASLTGMLPLDLLKLAEADQVYFFLEDIRGPLFPMIEAQMNPELTAEEKAKVYEDVLAPDGDLKRRLGQLNDVLAKREGKFLAGDDMSHADVAVFAVLANFKSGWMEGVPKDILSSYPACKEFRNMIASLPEVAAYYKTHDDDVTKTGFTPDA